MSFYTFKYRPDEQFYELGKGVDIESPWVGKRQFLKNREADFTGSVTTQVNIEVANSELELYSIFNISSDVNLDFKIFKLEDKTFSSKSLRSKNDSLRVVIYAKRIYSKASLKDDDDSNLTDGAKSKISTKDYASFVRNYGNYYVSAVEKVQVSVIALDFVNVEKDQINKFTNDFSSSTSYSDALNVGTTQNLETFIEKKFASSELNVQLFDFNKYNFQKDDDTAKLLIGGNAAGLLTSINSLLEKRLETFSFDNAASVTFYLSPMSNFDIPEPLIPRILDTRLDEQGQLLYKLYNNYDILQEISESDNFKLFPDQIIQVEVKRLNEILKTLQQSLSAQTKSFLNDSKKDLSKNTSLKDEIKYPNYNDDGFLNLTFLENSTDYQNYKDYVGKLTAFFIDKYSHSPLEGLNMSKIYDNALFFHIQINQTITLITEQNESVEYLLNLSNGKTALVFRNSSDKFDLPDLDHAVKLELLIRFIDPMPFVPLHPKFRLQAIISDKTYQQGRETILAEALTTSTYDNIYGVPPTNQTTLEEVLSTINSKNTNLTLKHFFNYEEDKKLSGYILTYLGHFDPNENRAEPETSPNPLFIQKISIKINTI